MRELVSAGSSERANGALRVALIIDTPSGEIGGTEYNTVHLSRALLDAGHRPVIVEIGSKSILPRMPEARGIEIVHLDSPDFAQVPFGVWRALLRTLSVNVVVRSKNWVERSNLSLDAAVRLAGLVYLGWEHHQAKPFPPRSGRLAKLPTFGRWKAKKLLHARAAHRTVAISEAVIRPLIHDYFFSPAQVDLIYPGIDFGLFRRSASGRERSRADWGIPDGAVVVGSVGRLAPNKRNDFALRVFAEVRRSMPNREIVCVLAGRGPDSDRLQQLAAAIGVDQAVRLPGWQQSTPDAWSAIDVMLMPSDEEGLGMTLIEAVACGAVPLASNVGGMTEVMYGVLQPFSLPPDDEDKWVNALSHLLQLTDADRRALGDAAYVQLRGRFDAATQWPAMVRWVEGQAR